MLSQGRESFGPKRDLEEGGRAIRKASMTYGNAEERPCGYPGVIGYFLRESARQTYSVVHRPGIRKGTDVERGSTFVQLTFHWS